ncbi:FAD-dependent oxidoreductase (plasmid) [Rhizobium bangladeshense]|uniref:NAD(P)/FAD-dependent oxidoreductase n=1 Tax=Rhizobium bangladeshense TaxID=1138189 RepID=UPI001A97E2E7|nr:FAD-dependent oxidoreductase [Rhizobium bangladeshense]QSY97872.1 FAD-dependent oxidoreductase [Rhizobium bangladeshense]
MPNRHFDVLIIGGGHSARRVAEGAREANETSSIALIGEEAHLPYDRPPLSKQVLTTSDWKSGHGPAWFADRRINTILGTSVVGVDHSRRTLMTSDGESLGWGRLVFCTGSRPRRLEIGVMQERLHFLRTIDDAMRLSERLESGRSIAVVGAGFIGLEVAAAARQKGAAVNVFEAARHSMARVIPGFLAERVENRHVVEGVNFEFGSIATRERLQGYDDVVVGVGVLPNIELAAACGVSCDDGIVIDAFGKTNLDDVFAAGEVVRVPPAEGGPGIRRESWQMAEAQGFAVGQTVGGKPTSYVEIPWFWSDQYDLNIQVLGDLSGDSEWLIRGTLSSPSFAAFAIANGEVRGVFALNAGREIAGARRLMARGIRPDFELLADPRKNWNEILVGKSGSKATTEAHRGSIR